MTNAIVQAAHQSVIDTVARQMGDEVFISNTKAAKILGMDPDTLTQEGNSGHIQYRSRGTRRFYSLPFMVEYLLQPKPEAEKCPSIGRKTRTAKTAPRSTTTTSSGVVVGFRDARKKRQNEKLKP